MTFKLIIGYICEPIIWVALGMSVWILCGRIGWYAMMEVNEHYNWEYSPRSIPGINKIDTFLLGPFMILIAVVDYICIMYSRIFHEIKLLQKDRQTRWDK